MTAIEIARRMTELGQEREALQAYTLAATQGGLTPEEELEAAVHILQGEGNYEISYTCFLNLYRRGFFQEETLSLMTGAFYEPNVKELRKRYEQNCKFLKKYPYLFRKDFPAFEDLPILFYPYNTDRYIPYFTASREFGEFTHIKEPVINRNFFRDLENPVLAADVYSQYELEYLRDNVRKSEYVAKENHIYLHYTDWGEFCSWLQVLNLRPLLKEEKIVFLIEDEIAQYPIDFKARFGIDYSQYPLKPVGIREVTRLIWSVQLQSHNGIIFFNEILDGHPNLIAAPVIMFDKVQDGIRQCKEDLKGIDSVSQIIGSTEQERRVVRELYLLKDQTDKDILLSGYLRNEQCTKTLDPASRIAPALLFSPHFGSVRNRLQVDPERNMTIISFSAYEQIRNSPILQSFKYIKTVAPMRRPTTSSAAAVRFMWVRNLETREQPDKENHALKDEIPSRLLNRAYLYDPQDRLFQDAVLMRFEDGKLNPRATFTALAEFLDLPYTESLTYCSHFGERDPESLKGSARGFDPRAVYETYEEYLGEPERYFMEYFTRDIYETYGYDFHYYDGKPMDEARVEELCGQFKTLDHYIEESWRHVKPGSKLVESVKGQVHSDEEIQEILVQRALAIHHENRLEIGKALLRGLHFINDHSQELWMIPLLKLDPALLDQPLYR